MEFLGVCGFDLHPGLDEVDELFELRTSLFGLFDYSVEVGLC